MQFFHRFVGESGRHSGTRHKLHELASRRRKLRVTCGIIGSLIVVASHAGPLTIPNTFVPGTPARAEQVNQNFDSIAATVNANDERLAGLSRSPAGGLLVKVGTTVLGKQVMNIRSLATVFVETDEFNNGFVAFNQKGLFVVVGTGAIGDVPSTGLDEFVGLNTTLPAEGSLLPLSVGFTGPNCTGTPFISLSPLLVRQGIVFGNPRNPQEGYFAQGTLSQMQVQSVLLFLQPNGLLRFLSRDGGAGAPFCADASDSSFQQRTILGVPAVPNDPQVTGVPNGISGPISYTLTH